MNRPTVNRPTVCSQCGKPFSRPGVTCGASECQEAEAKANQRRAKRTRKKQPTVPSTPKARLVAALAQAVEARLAIDQNEGYEAEEAAEGYQYAVGELTGAITDALEGEADGEQVERVARELLAALGEA